MPVNKNEKVIFVFYNNKNTTVYKRGDYLSYCTPRYYYDTFFFAGIFLYYIDIVYYSVIKFFIRINSLSSNTSFIILLLFFTLTVNCFHNSIIITPARTYLKGYSKLSKMY